MNLDLHTTINIFRERINDLEIYLNDSNNSTEICLCNDVFTRVESEDKLKDCFTKNQYIEINTHTVGKKGVYFFYTKNENEELEFWYIGECHEITKVKTSNGSEKFEWDLCHRLKQHFVKSQSSGLLARVMKQHDFDENIAKNYLIENKVKLGYIPMMNENHDTAAILLAESIMITKFNPKYNIQNY